MEPQHATSVIQAIIAEERDKRSVASAKGVAEKMIKLLEAA